jgi:hypothetical protein
MDSLIEGAFKVLLLLSSNRLHTFSIVKDFLGDIATLFKVFGAIIEIRGLVQLEIIIVMASIVNMNGGRTPARNPIFKTTKPK